AIENINPFCGKHERMPHFLHAAQRLEFLIGAYALVVECFEAAVDELYGLQQAAGAFALPDFAEPAAAERLDEAIAWNGLRIGLPQEAHESTLTVRAWRVARPPPEDTAGPSARSAIRAYASPLKPFKE